jgi:acyl-ACP--UDP-N-acetylglucosamine O-acyltransferase
MSNISPLAHVDPEAKIGENVTIHPFAFISKNTEIGDGCTIYPFVSILTGARIGKNNKIYNGSIIGAEPQDFHWHGEQSFCYIGDDNVIREHTIINRGSNPDGGTRIHDKCFIMAETHISHDAEICSQCVIGNGAQVSGNVKINSYTILSSNSMVYAGSEIGRWVMIKGGCRISGNVPPFVIMAHNPTAYAGINAFNMRRFGNSEAIIDDVAKSYRHLYECNTSVFNALKRIEADIEPSPERDEIINFIKDHNLHIVAVPSHSEEEE